MFCNQCGANIADRSTFCPQCGIRFGDPGLSATPPGGTPPPPPGATVNPQPQPPFPGSSFSPMNLPPQPVYTGPVATDGKAIGSLVAGILSVTFFSFLAGIPAVVLGHMSRSQIKKSMGRLKGEGMALAGLIMGYLSIALIPFFLIIAAIAIPNLLRARMLANESAAATVMRTLVNNNVIYSMNYPDRGYAPDLATLGPGPDGSCAGEGAADHACLIDNVLGNRRCTVATWCAKGAYNFTLVSTGGTPATDFVIAATPVSDASGMKSYCATADGVIRRRSGQIATSPTVQECLRWTPL